MFAKSTFPKMLAAAVVLAVLFVTGPAPAQDCPPHLADDPCTVDLISELMSGGCGAAPHYQVHSPPTDSNGDGWLETAIEIDLTTECSRVCVVLDYTETPTGFTLNLGDSPTNNGYGGNSGGPESASEVQIANQRLSLWTDGFSLGPGVVDELATADLRLANGSYKVCVSNQHVTFGQPQSTVSTPNYQLLFALPDTNPGVPAADQYKVYVGLNRVIDVLGGSPSAGRTGTGLRRAHITID